MVHCVESVETRGKGLLINFDNRLSICSHNQLYGRWFVRPAHHLPARRSTIAPGPAQRGEIDPALQRLGY
jgi:formamidopyrimidine-DNA glycosylase